MSLPTFQSAHARLRFTYVGGMTRGLTISCRSGDLHHKARQEALNRRAARTRGSNNKRSSLSRPAIERLFSDCRARLNVFVGDALRREVAGEGASSTERAVDLECRAMPLQHVLHDGEAEARTA